MTRQEAIDKSIIFASQYLDMDYINDVQAARIGRVLFANLKAAKREDIFFEVSEPTNKELARFAVNSKLDPENRMEWVDRVEKLFDEDPTTRKQVLEKYKKYHGLDRTD